MLFDFIVFLGVFRPKRTVISVVCNGVDFVRLAYDVDGGMCTFLAHSSAPFLIFRAAFADCADSTVEPGEIASKCITDWRLWT